MLALLLLASLAPGVARALAFSRGDTTSWAAVCSAQAGQQAGAANTGDPAGLAGHLLTHCPFCVLHNDSLAPPPSSGAVLPAGARGHAVPRLFFRAAHTLQAWTPAQARAPPLGAR